MGDVDGGLLKCVLQLAACSDKLRSTDLMLGGFVTTMRKQLAPTDIPVLKARLAVVAVDSMNPPRDQHARFQELFDHGSEATERLELSKSRLEKELRRRSEQFHELVSSRNTDLQEEYKRMLTELEDQEATLMQQIADERATQQSHKRRRISATQSMKQLALQAKETTEQENARLQLEIAQFSSEIKNLQDEFAVLEEEHSVRLMTPRKEREATSKAAAAVQDGKDEEEEDDEEEELLPQVTSLRREVELLREANASIAASQEASFKDQYEAEKAELDDEIGHLNQVTEEIQQQLGSHGKRLHALVGTLAPNSSTGSLMTRLFKQLMSDPTSGGPRKTVELQGFLKSCPSVEEGKRAIDEMTKLQLIYCYETSGIVALAD